MRAQPALPTLSAREVAQIGAAAVAEARKLPREIAGVPIVVLALEGVPRPGGLVELRDEAGRVCGICASGSVADRTINFFR
jgi:hypothetical protein